MMGLANGTMYPALSVLLACWIPEKERGKLGVFVLGGAQVHFDKNAIKIYENLVFKTITQNQSFFQYFVRLDFSFHFMCLD